LNARGKKVPTALGEGELSVLPLVVAEGAANNGKLEERANLLLDQGEDVVNKIGRSGMEEMDEASVDLEDLKATPGGMGMIESTKFGQDGIVFSLNEILYVTATKRGVSDGRSEETRAVWFACTADDEAGVAGNALHSYREVRRGGFGRLSA
jgi:hypothetical protein